MRGYDYSRIKNHRQLNSIPVAVIDDDIKKKVPELMEYLS